MPEISRRLYPPARPLLPAAIFIFVALFLLFRQWPRDDSPAGPADGAAAEYNYSAADSELQYDFPPFLRLYRSGRVERLRGTAVVPASGAGDPAAGVTATDIVMDSTTGISARIFLPSSGEKLPLLVFFHGGAFVIESAFSPTYTPFLTAIARRGIAVVSVEYRLAPEHPLPAAYDDAFAALNWLALAAPKDAAPFNRTDLSRIFVTGESAGGNIAHNAVLRVGKESGSRAHIKGLILMNPYFWGASAVGSETTDAAVRFRMEDTWRFVTGWKYGLDSPLVDPSVAPAEWKKLGCERVLVTVSDLDLFYSRGVAYARGLRRSGFTGTVELYETNGEDHCYFISQPASKKAIAEMDAVVAFIQSP